MHGTEGPGGESLTLLPSVVLNAGPESRREEIASRHPAVQATGSELMPEAPAAWFFLLAEEILGRDIPGFSWLKDPGSLKCSEARRYVLMRDNRTCAIHACREEVDLTVHHILPRAWGGTHHPGNLVTLCTRCHRNLCETCTRSVSSRVPPPSCPP